MSVYYVDGELMANEALIDLADSLGVMGLEGVKLSAKGAAEILRRGGYHVSDKPCTFNHPDEPCSEACVEVRP